MNKGVIQPNITQFLRTEAKTIYKNLPLELRKRTTKQAIFTQLKKAWKEGDRVKREYRQGKKDEVITNGSGGLHSSPENHSPKPKEGKTGSKELRNDSASNSPSNVRDRRDVIADYLR